MRIILMGLQITVLMIMIFISVAAGGGLASLSAVSAGYGPAAMAAGVYILTIFAAAAVGFVAIVLPVSILAATTLVFAISAGYRYLRWTRFLGMCANLAAMALIILPHFLAENYPVIITAFLLLYPCVNALLFLLMPRVPKVTLTRRLCRIAVPCLYLPVLGIVLLVFFGKQSNLDTWSYVIFSIFLLLYLFPFYYGYHTLSYTKQPTSALATRLGILILMTVPVLLLVFPLGLPLAMSLYLLLALSEISLLYPTAAPPPGGVRYWMARTLGRLPAASAAMTPTLSESPAKYLPPPVPTDEQHSSISQETVPAAEHPPACDGE